MGALQRPSPPAAQYSPGGGAGGTPDVPPEHDPFDLSADPILQRIRALSQRGRADAQAEAQRLISQLAIEYGDEEAGGAAAAANPFSIKKKLAEARVKEPRQLIESLNKENLFYSSTKDIKENDLLKDLLGRETSASNAYRGARGDISENLRRALLGYDESDAEALGGAEERLRDRYGDLPIRRNRGANPPTNLGGLVGGLIGGSPRPGVRPRPPKRRPIGGWE
jgi:hypothetical protein